MSHGPSFDTTGSRHVTMPQKDGAGTYLIPRKNLAILPIDPGRWRCRGYGLKSSQMKSLSFNSLPKPDSSSTLRSAPFPGSCVYRHDEKASRASDGA